MIKESLTRDVQAKLLNITKMKNGYLILLKSEEWEENFLTNNASFDSKMIELINGFSIDEGKQFPLSLKYINVSCSITETITMSGENQSIKISLNSVRIVDPQSVKKVNENLAKDTDYFAKSYDENHYYNIITEGLPIINDESSLMMGNYEDQVLTGQLNYVTDGDTINFKIASNNGVSYDGEEGDKLIGKDVSIRFAGIDARETSDRDGRSEQRTEQTNEEWLRTEGLWRDENSDELLNKAKDLGEEATRLVKGILDQEPDGVYTVTAVFTTQETIRISATTDTTNTVSEDFIFGQSEGEANSKQKFQFKVKLENKTDGKPATGIQASDLNFSVTKESGDIPIGVLSVVSVVEDRKEVVILVDPTKQHTDTFNRIVGIVFKERQHSNSSLNKYINLNKTLLASKSMSFEGQALAIPSIYKAKDGTVDSLYGIENFYSYTPDLEKLKPEIETEKQKAKASRSMDKFMENRNLSVDNEGVVVYNGNKEKRIEIEQYKVQETDKRYQTIIAKFNTGETFTTVESIAQENGYSKEAFILMLSKGYLKGNTITIPILKNFSDTTESQIVDYYKTNLNNIPAESEREEFYEELFDDRDKLIGINRNEMSNNSIDRMYNAGFTRIGDLTLFIPPINITSNEVTQTKKHQTLNGKSSIMSQTGNTAQQITLTLYFGSEEGINGQKVENSEENPLLNPLLKGPEETKQDWYINGLRQLVAQFKKFPFLPIENDFVNESLGVFNVALTDLTLQTVPGFPKSIKAELLLSDFDHNCFMPSVEDYSSAFNWRMFRWYYQEMFQEKYKDSPNKTYLEPYKEDNHISFGVLREEELAQRKKALLDMENEIAPETFKDRAIDKPENKFKLLEGKQIEEAKKQQNVFYGWLKKHPIDEYPLFYNSKGVFNGINYDSITEDKEELVRYAAALDEMLAVVYTGGVPFSNKTTLADIEEKYEEIYDSRKKLNIEVPSEIENNADMLYPCYFIPNSIHKIRKFVNKVSNTIIARGTIVEMPLYDFNEQNNYEATNIEIINNYMFIGHGGISLSNDMPKSPSALSGYGLDHSGVYDSTLIESSRKNAYMLDIDNVLISDISGGCYNILVGSRSALSKATRGKGKVYLDNIRDHGYFFRFSPYNDTLLMDSMIDEMNQLIDSLDVQEYEYNQDRENAFKDESEIGMDFYDFGKELIITGFSAQLSNNLVPMIRNGEDGQAHQYLGAKDTQFNLELTTKSKRVVADLRGVFKRSQKLMREYKIALTSSVVTIDFNLLRFLGVKDVLFNTLSVRTSDQDKETFIINISLIGFNKKQQNLEAVEKFGLGDFIKNEDDYYDFSDNLRKNRDADYTMLDFKLRDAEVYPSLELPTYDELNLALPFLNVKDVFGYSYEHLPNPTGAKYLNPDFFIRASTTIRSEVMDLIENRRPGIHFEDSSGFEGIDYGPRPGSETLDDVGLVLDASTKAWIDENFKDETMQYDEPAGTSSNSPITGAFSGFEANKMNTELIDKIDELEYENKTLAKEIDKLTSVSYEDSINHDEFDMESIVGKVMDEDYQGKNPNQSEVAKYIEKMINKYFSNIESNSVIEENGYELDYYYGTELISPPVITKIKITNIFKAICEVKSGWNQFTTTSNKRVPIITQTGDIGISGINMNSGVFKTEYEILRAARDWKYCLEKGVKAFALGFLKTQNINNDNKRRNPLDWAICLYEYDKLKKEDPNEIEVDRSNLYMNVINKFAVTWSNKEFSTRTPDSPFNEDQITVSDSKKEIAILISKLLKDYSSINSIFGGETQEAKKKKYSKITGDLNLDDAIAETISRSLKLAKIKKERDNTYYVGKSSGASIDSSINKKFIEFMKETDKVPVLILDSSNEFSKAKSLESEVQYTDYYINPGGNVDGTLNDGMAYLGTLGYGEREYENFLLDMIKHHLHSRFTDQNSKYKKFDIANNAVIIKSGAAQEVSEHIDKFRSKDLSTLKEINWDKVYSVMNLSTDERVKDFNVSIQKAATLNRFLYKPESLIDSYRKSFDDLLRFDHRGRMVQAFPTFHLNLIEEGRWSFWFRMWDNFYGVNGVSEINVHKDRQIAADTVVMKLSNMYHNLNSDIGNKNFGEWDKSVMDIISTSADDRSEARKLLLNLPDEDIIMAKAEKIRSLILKPGARMHLRMGYGSNAYALPVMFNGTITQMDTQDIMTVVAQGDGMEFTNILNVDKDASADGGFFEFIQEPRDVMGNIMTSKGGLFKNVINEASDGKVFRDNAHGIVHFGAEETPMTLFGLAGDIQNMLIDQEYGECCVNIYSSAGIETLSDWVFMNGERIGMKTMFGIIPTNSKGDEPNIDLYLGGKTVWDVFQSYATICPDYIASIVPFDYRSTVFFGKPWWGAVKNYEYQYKYDEKTEVIERVPIGGRRTTFSQARLYTSGSDILSNQIIASADGVYNTVVGIYNEEDGAKTTAPVHIDTDIYASQRRSARVSIPIKASYALLNNMTQKKFAEAAAANSLRDYVKNMYKGNLLVFGDPTVKPYDYMYIEDRYSDMRGTTGVGKVTHHFSSETGFVTNIEPDCLSIVDDSQGISHINWVTSGMSAAAAIGIGYKTSAALWKSYITAPFFRVFKKYGDSAASKLSARIMTQEAIDKLDIGRTEQMKLMELSEDIVKDWEKLAKRIESKDASLDEIIKFWKNDKTRDLVKKRYGWLDDVNDVVNKRGVSKVIDETLLPTLRTLMDYGKQATDNPSNVFKFVDDVWDWGGLNKFKLFKKGGLIKSPINMLARTGVGTVKFGLKTTGYVGAKSIRGLARVLNKVPNSLLIGISAEVVITIVSANLFESYRRFLRNRQALTIIPLIYRNKEFTAGIDGHKGSVMGDAPSRYDKFFEGTGFASEMMSLVNFVTDADPDYSPDDPTIGG